MSITATAITTAGVLLAGLGGLLVADRFGLVQLRVLDDQPELGERPGTDDQFGEWLGNDLGQMADNRERAEETLGRKS